MFKRKLAWALFPFMPSRLGDKNSSAWTQLSKRAATMQPCMTWASQKSATHFCRTNSRVLGLLTFQRKGPVLAGWLPSMQRWRLRRRIRRLNISVPKLTTWCSYIDPWCFLHGYFFGWHESSIYTRLRHQVAKKNGFIGEISFSKTLRKPRRFIFAISRRCEEFLKGWNNCLSIVSVRPLTFSWVCLQLFRRMHWYITWQWHIKHNLPGNSAGDLFGMLIFEPYEVTLMLQPP